MIYPDLTEIFEKYPEWDFIVRNKYLRYALKLMEQHQRISFRGEQYHNIEDFKVDLEAEFCSLDSEK